MVDQLQGKARELGESSRRQTAWDGITPWGIGPRTSGEDGW